MITGAVYHETERIAHLQIVAPFEAQVLSRVKAYDRWNPSKPPHPTRAPA